MRAGVAGVFTPPLVYIRDTKRASRTRHPHAHAHTHGPTPPLETLAIYAPTDHHDRDTAHDLAASHQPRPQGNRAPKPGGLNAGPWREEASEGNANPDLPLVIAFSY